MDATEEFEKAPDSLVGKRIAERYEILARLGEGAMGAVYRAQHVHMQKVVALKVLHQETSLNPEVVKRFEREAVAAGKVVHPNVAGAQDFGRLENGCFYLVLEYVHGKSLRDVIEENGAMPLERVLRLSEQIAAALGAAHAQGIVHRDLKPENAMILDEPAGADFLKVLDFGLAKISDEDATDTKLTKMGAVYGTPQYMAPEQAAGNPVDHRVDLYALGCMMFEMLTGRPPFSSEQIMALLIKHMTEAPPPLPETLPPAVRTLVMQLLEKDPANRPQSAEEVLARLAEFDPTLARGSRLSIAGAYAPYSRPASMPYGPSSPYAPSVGSPKPPGVAQASNENDWKTRLRPLVEKGAIFAKKPLKISGRDVPQGYLAFGVLALVGLGLLVPLLGRSDAADVQQVGATSSGSSSVTEEPVDPELARVLDQAKQGLDSALYALEQRKDSERSTREWMALAQARLIRKKVPEALAAFKNAIDRDPSQADDKTMLWALRVLAEKEEFSKSVLNFAAENLGSTGADMLFFVWARTSQKTVATTVAGDLLKSSSVKAKWSKALTVAMKLRDAEDCDDYKDLLPLVFEAGDDRTMVRMRELEKTRGCGPTKRDDCYPCLREGKQFAEAMNQAAMRAAPQFDASKKFRFKDDE